MVYRFGDCLLDTERHQLQRAGQPVRLRAKAFQALCYLLAHRDRTVLKSELCAQVWPQAFISEATLESTVRAVRQAIGDGGRAQQLIHTVYGYGYHFVAAAEEVSELPPSAAGEIIPSPAASGSAPPQDHDLHAALAPGTLEPAGGEDGGWAPGLRDEGRPTPQQAAPRLPPTTQAGEWKLVTVLCCAPVTSSAGGARQDAEVRYRQLAHLYAVAQRVVPPYGGMLHPVLGEHVLVVFGAPVAQEDHAQRAVLAALELERRVREADMDVGAHQGNALVLCMGSYTGQVAVGGIGDTPAGVVGETVMRAIALQAQAASGMIVCSDAPARHAWYREWCRLRQWGGCPWPGSHRRSRHTQSWGGAYGGGPSSTVSAAGGRRLSGASASWRPCVHCWHRRRRAGGKSWEWWASRAWASHDSSLSSSVVFAANPSPIELPAVCPTARPARICPSWRCCGSTAASPRGTPRPPWPPRCAPVSRQSAWRRRSGPPYLLHLLGVPTGAAGVAGLSPEVLKARTLDALVQLALHGPRQRPLVVEIENVHWMDPSSEEVVAALVEQLGGHVSYSY